ncbi:Crp/Fnr family transcriptional regulator [Belnapia mucosa]|uniref:Crp/Fnr family transcriptional regulator n=1 Tax=Belnapia mucosa TaxID=2804532 RepID=UPI001F3DC414|nr:Crp/Fnr family transcriptional regulator [Belnapia mucosa]
MASDIAAGQWSARAGIGSAEPHSGHDEPAGRFARSAAELARQELFRGLPEAQIAQLAAQVRWRWVDPGEAVLDYGDLSTDVFLVEDGSLRVLVRTPAGQEVFLSDVFAGELFGELAAIRGTPRSANVTALHRSRLCVIPATVFLTTILKSPDAALRLMRILTDRIRTQSDRLVELTVLPVRHRLYAELLRLSRRRGSGGERVISPPPPHHVIAARIGARREPVSRELSELSRQAMIQTSRRAIVVLRPEVLQAAIEAKLHGRDN